MDIEQYLEQQAPDEEKVIKELFDLDKSIEAKTDLSQEQIVEICKLKHLARKYKMGELGLFIKEFMRLSISKNRQGRKEFIDALKSARENKEGMIGFSGLRDRLR